MEVNIKISDLFCISAVTTRLPSPNICSVFLYALCSLFRYTVPTAAWACCWHREEPQYFFAGLQNNKVLLFDVRNTNQHVAEVGAVAAGSDAAATSTADTPVHRGPPLSGPVVSMCHVTPGAPGSCFR